MTTNNTNLQAIMSLDACLEASGEYTSGGTRWAEDGPGLIDVFTVAFAAARSWLADSLDRIHARLPTGSRPVPVLVLA